MVGCFHIKFHRLKEQFQGGTPSLENHWICVFLLGGESLGKGWRILSSDLYIHLIFCIIVLSLYIHDIILNTHTYVYMQEIEGHVDYT